MLTFITVTDKETTLIACLQGGKSVYNSFDPGHKEQSQSALEALLRAKLLSTDNDDQKEDCTEGAALKHSCLCSGICVHHKCLSNYFFK